MCMSRRDPMASNATITLQGSRQAGRCNQVQTRYLLSLSLSRSLLWLVAALQVALQHFNSLQYHFQTFSYVNLCILPNVWRGWTLERRAGSGPMPAAAKDEICVGLHKSTNWSAANMIFIFWELNYFLFANVLKVRLSTSNWNRYVLQPTDRNNSSQTQSPNAQGPDVKECEGCPTVYPELKRLWLQLRQRQMPEGTHMIYLYPYRGFSWLIDNDDCRMNEWRSKPFTSLEMDRNS